MTTPQQILTTGEEELKRDYTLEELAEDLKTVKIETGYGTEFNTIVISDNERDYQESVATALAKNNALREEMKKIPKRIIPQNK